MDLRHIFGIVKYILASDNLPASKSAMLTSYLRMIAGSFYYHKFANHNDQVQTQKILGHRVRFLSYPELIHLFEEIFILQIYFKPGNIKTIVDCGSNIGLSVLFFKVRFPESKILAFEPDTDNYRLLMENIQNNNLQNVYAFKVALSDENATGELFAKVRSNGINTINFTLNKAQDVRKKENVMIRRLSEFIKEPVSLLKVDVEGSELAIIQDLLISKAMHYIDKIVVELHPTVVKLSMIDFARLLEGNFARTGYSKVKFNESAEEWIIYGENDGEFKMS